MQRRHACTSYQRLLSHCSFACTAKAQAGDKTGKITADISINFAAQQLSAKMAYDYIASEDSEAVIKFCLSEALNVNKVSFRLCRSFVRRPLLMGQSHRRKPTGLARKLLVIRKRLGVSQTEMARLLNLRVAYTVVSGYERGKSEPDLLERECHTFAVHSGQYFGCRAISNRQEESRLDPAIGGCAISAAAALTATA